MKKSQPNLVVSISSGVLSCPEQNQSTNPHGENTRVCQCCTSFLFIAGILAVLLNCLSLAEEDWAYFGGFFYITSSVKQNFVAFLQFSPNHSMATNTLCKVEKSSI